MDRHVVGVWFSDMFQWEAEFQDESFDIIPGPKKPLALL
jgi:hypothetical protein